MYACEGMGHVGRYFFLLKEVEFFFLFSRNYNYYEGKAKSKGSDMGDDLMDFFNVRKEIV